MLDEIVPSLDVPGAEQFAREVMDRFANPFLQHSLFDITLQGTTKFKVRVVPSILDFARRTGTSPRALALGFAGFLAFQDGSLQAQRRAAGESVPADATADRVRAHWAGVEDSIDGLTSFVRTVAADTALWGTDLSAVSGFVEQVAEHLHTIRSRGAVAAIEALELPSVR